MADKQPRAFLEASWQASRERQGLAGLVQCEGCPDTCLVPETQGVCWRHDFSPHAAEAYEPHDPYEGYDVIGNL